MNARMEQGQAMTETLVTLLALVPLLVVVPYLGKYLDVKDKAASAARYAAWERTVWSDPGASWNVGENSKDDATIAREIGDRLLGSADRAVLGAPQVGASRNTLWQDYTGAELVTLDAFEGAGGNGAGASVSERTSPASNAIPVETIAFGGPVLGNQLEALGGVAATFGDVLNGVIPDLGDVVGFGLDIGERSFSDTAAGIPAETLPQLSRRGVAVDFERPASGTPPLTFRQRGAVLADDWSVADEERFVDRIDGLVVDEPLKFIVFPGTEVFGGTPAFPEGEQGADPDLESESEVLPPNDNIFQEVVR